MSSPVRNAGGICPCCNGDGIFYCTCVCDEEGTQLPRNISLRLISLSIEIVGGTYAGTYTFGPGDMPQPWVNQLLPTSAGPHFLHYQRANGVLGIVSVRLQDNYTVSPFVMYTWVAAVGSCLGGDTAGSHSFKVGFTVGEPLFDFGLAGLEDIISYADICDIDPIFGIHEVSGSGNVLGPLGDVDGTFNMSFEYEIQPGTEMGGASILAFCNESITKVMDFTISEGIYVRQAQLEWVSGTRWEVSYTQPGEFFNSPDTWADGPITGYVEWTGTGWDAHFEDDTGVLYDGSFDGTDEFARCNDELCRGFELYGRATTDTGFREIVIV